MNRLVPLLVVVLVTCVVTAARAQSSLAGFDRLTAFKYEKLGDKHYLLTGSVELERGDMSIFADSIEYFEDQERAIATGNVVIIQGNNRIAADRADFNTTTQLGTFYQASGIAAVRQGRNSSPLQGGLSIPQMSGQDNDVYYFGETVEKLGPKKYRIHNGGFSTCVQPTPRWDLSADTIVLNIDHYTLLKSALLNVKGVPLFYLPVMYYPTKDEERATGFLIPTYGLSSIRGQSIHNGFFWAINRSHDATFMYDWFSKTGTGAGTEYRYNLGGGSDGQMTVYSLDQRAATLTNADGTLSTQAAERTFTIRGSANQSLPGRFRARGQVDYFSSIRSNQTFNTDVFSATRNQRRYNAYVFGTLAGMTVNGTFERSEWFTAVSSDSTSSQVVGSSPRIALTRSERPLFGTSSIYFGATGEYARLDRLTKTNDAIVANGNRSLSRLDFAPQIRVPFKRWPFLTVNSTIGWRNTFYTRSQDPLDEVTILDQSLNRQFFTIASQAIGPVFTRVWNTPKNGYAERFKHTIEPVFNIQRTSAVDDYRSIVKIDSSDYTVGSTTNISYGINNRLYAKRRLGQSSQAIEILALEINQSYYTNALASQVDTRYATVATTMAATNFSPIRVSLRASPTQSVNAALSAEVDSKYKALRQVSANGTVNWRQLVQASAGWSHRFYIADLAGFNNRDGLDHYLNARTNVQTRDRRYGAIYDFNYDILRSALLQQRVSGFYNAQCCGIALEYQRYSLAGLPSYLAPAENRFFLSFTLAGLGNFSPFNGGLGGIPR